MVPCGELRERGHPVGSRRLAPSKLPVFRFHLLYWYKRRSDSSRNDERTEGTSDLVIEVNDMRTVNQPLVEEYASKIRPHLHLASKAVGVQPPDSPARAASNRVNQLIREYMDEKGGNMTHLANALEGDISLPGLRRRLRASRGQTLGSFSTSRKRGSTDPVEVKDAAHRIRQAKEYGTKEDYRTAVREVYAANISLTAVAAELQCSYFALWSAGTAG